MPNYKPLNHTIRDHINGLSKFKPRNERVTFEDVKDVMLRDIPNPIPIHDGDNVYREQGCHGGPCACTGDCRQLIPYSVFDLLLHKNYTELLKLITPIINNQLETFYGKNENP